MRHMVAMAKKGRKTLQSFLNDNVPKTERIMAVHESLNESEVS